MRSAYREERWVEVNKCKETGEYQDFLHKDEYGIVHYRFFKKKAGNIKGVDFYDIASYRGAEGPYIESVVPGKEEVLFKSFDNAFEKYCIKHNIIAEFAKLDPWDDYAELIRNNYGGEYYGNYYCNNLQLDFYKEEYNRRSKRSIKKAIEAGIIVSKDFTGETVSNFIELYKNTEEKFHTSEYYKMTEEDIKRYFEIYGDDAFLINASLKEKIITSVLVVMGEDIVHYLLLGSDPQYSEFQANSLLTYEAALYGKTRGKKLFDMGGGIPGGGIEQFKRNFITDDGIWKYYAIKKIRNKKIYDIFVKKKTEIKNQNYFPLYRG